MNITRQYVTIAEAMQITGLSRTTFWRRIKDGNLSKVEWSGKILIPASSIMPETSCNKGGHNNERIN